MQRDARDVIRCAVSGQESESEREGGGERKSERDGDRSLDYWRYFSSVIGYSRRERSAWTRDSERWIAN